MNSMSGSGGYGRLSGAGSSKTPGYNQVKIGQYTPEQSQLFQQQFGMVGPDSYTARMAGGDQSMFDEIERPALQQFGELQGNIASRFSGMGMGGRRSSGFQNTMNQAGSDFAQQLQSNRQGLQRQAIQDLMGYSNQILGQKPYEQMLQPKKKKKSFLQQLLSGGMQLGGAALGSFAGPIGTAAGAKLGSWGSQAADSMFS